MYSIKNSMNFFGFGMKRGKLLPKQLPKQFEKHIISKYFSLGVLFGIFITFCNQRFILPGNPTPKKLIFPPIIDRDKISIIGSNTISNDKILCWILTKPENHMRKAIHVKNTWARRCDKYIFMSTQDDLGLGAVKIPKASEGYYNLWEKSKLVSEYLYDNHLYDADWFFKADDDTYVIVENLRKFLRKFDPAKPLYIGNEYKDGETNRYMDGGSGYVLSRAALKIFVERGIRGNICSHFEGGEDTQTGECLSLLGVKRIDGRDGQGRLQFFRTFPHQYIIHQEPETYWEWKRINVKPGYECCSDTPISIHNSSPEELYTLEYLIYKIKRLK